MTSAFIPQPSSRISTTSQLRGTVSEEMVIVPLPWGKTPPRCERTVGTWSGAVPPDHGSAGSGPGSGSSSPMAQLGLLCVHELGDQLIKADLLHGTSGLI